MYANHVGYNALADFLEDNKLGWTSGSALTAGKRFVDGMSRSFLECNPSLWKALNDRHNIGASCLLNILRLSYMHDCDSMRYCHVLLMVLKRINTNTILLAGYFPLDIALEPFFNAIPTASKIDRAKRGNMELSNTCITTALVGMELWIAKGNWVNGFGAIFLGFRDAMQKYVLRLIGQVEWQAQVNSNPSPIRSATNALKLYVKE
jgi:hypothetical protein